MDEETLVARRVVCDHRHLDLEQVDRTDTVKRERGAPAEERIVSEREQRPAQAAALRLSHERADVHATVAADETPLLDETEQLPIAEPQLSDLLDSEHAVLPASQRRQLPPPRGAVLTLSANNPPSTPVAPQQARS